MSRTKTRKTPGEDVREDFPGDGEVGKLTPGSHARIFRDGGVLEGLIAIPSQGPVELRHLAPGSYVLRDECGMEQAVQVSAKEETTVVPTQAGGKVVQGTAEPGSSFVSEIPIRDIGRQQDLPGPDTMRFPPRGRARRVSPESAERDVPVPAEPGSALIEEIDLAPAETVQEAVDAEKRREARAAKAENADARNPAVKERRSTAAKRAARSRKS